MYTVVPDDYTLLSQAITAGATNIFVRDGTHTESSNITVPCGVNILGQSRNAIIPMGTSSISTPTSAVYTTGTVSLPTSSTSLSGSGTAWLANISAGDVVIIDGLVFTVNSVNTDTSITLEEENNGTAISGAAYKSFTPCFFHMSKITITGSGSTLINVTQTVNTTLKNVYLRDTGTTGTGVTLDDCARMVISECDIRSQVTGISMTDSSSVVVRNNAISGGGTSGISFSGNILLCLFDANSITACESAFVMSTADVDRCTIIGNAIGYTNGVAMTGSTTSFVKNFKISDNYFYDTGDTAILLENDSENMIISDNTILRPNGRGISLPNSAHNDLNISDNVVQDPNTEGIIINNAASSHIVICGNVVAGSVTSDGITIDSNDCIASENICRGNNQSGIVITGDDNIINGNRCDANGNYGIEIVVGAARTTAVGNNTQGNTTGGLFDGPLTSNLSANI